MRCECPERFPRNQLQRKPLVSDHGMHHGTRVTHMHWCMPGSLTRCGKKVAGIPGACATRNFKYLATDPLCGECSCLWGTDMLRTIMGPTPNADPVWIILGVVVLLTGTPWLPRKGTYWCKLWPKSDLFLRWPLLWQIHHRTRGRSISICGCILWVQNLISILRRYNVTRLSYQVLYIMQWKLNYWFRSIHWDWLKMH